MTHLAVKMAVAEKAAQIIKEIKHMRKQNRRFTRGPYRYYLELKKFYITEQALYLTTVWGDKWTGQAAIRQAKIDFHCSVRDWMKGV